MTQKFDFSNPFLSPKGESVGQTLGEVLSNTLMTVSAKPPLSTKYFSWGLELIKSGVIEIDETDKKSLEDFINNSDNITVLTKGRLNEVLCPSTFNLPSKPVAETDGGDNSGGNPNPGGPGH